MEELPSAVWSATLNGEYDRADQLICSGANLNEPRITEKDNMTTLLHYATMKRDVQRMRLLINHGANCNASDSLKRTPLHWAVIGEDIPDVVEVLINGGAIVDARDFVQSTPLLIAFMNHCYQSMEKLIARGASIDAVDKNGWNLLHMTAMYGDSKDLRISKMLISLNINIEAEDDFGRTPLHYAVEDHNADVARLLLDNGADLNKKVINGESPLCMATCANCLASVHILLKRGAPINAVNNEGNTALHLACKMGFEEVVALLVKFGADMNVPNLKGKTALQLLLRNEPSSEAVAKIIIQEAVKRESLGQQICGKYREMVRSCKKYSKFHKECREEIKRLRSKRIDIEDCDVSFFDIFSKNEEKLAALARNNNIVLAFETSDYLKLFRIYAVDLTTKFEKAKRRANFLISIEDCLVDVLGDMVPAPILQKIAAYVEGDGTIENELQYVCRICKYQ